MKVSLISCTMNPIETCESCAAVCYNSEPSFKILKACVLSGHTSVLEAAYYTFKISGVSRALLAQITRHRIASYSVRSQRYCEEDRYGEDGALNYYVPKISGSQVCYYDMIEDSFNNYKQLLDYGMAKEDARMVLPNACNTTIMMTINLRSLGNFMGERLCTRAQKEIRECAKLMREEILNTMTDEEAKFFGEYWLVPKCRQHQKPMCEEQNSCGYSPSIKDYILIDKIKESIDSKNIIKEKGE